MTKHEGTASGRPRDDEIDAAVIEATQAAFRTMSFDEISLVQIASEADVSRNAIYRRWPTKADLVVDAATAAMVSLPVPDTGSLRGDLTALVRANADLLWGDDRNLFLAGLVAVGELGMDFKGIGRPRAEAVGHLWRRAAERGDLPSGVDPIITLRMLTGAAIFTTVVLGEPILDEDIDTMVSMVIGPS